MMDLYTGTPGSGKSYNVARLIYHGLRSKKNYICTFEVDLDKVAGRRRKISKLGKFVYIDRYTINPFMLQEYANEYHKHGVEHQTTIIIDEAHLIFNPQHWRNKDTLKWVEFFSLYRHLGYDIILITQHDRLVNKQIRSFIDNEFVHRELGNYKLFGKLISRIYGGTTNKTFFVIKKWYALPRSPILGKEMIRLNKRIAGIYDTHKVFNVIENDKNNEYDIHDQDEEEIVMSLVEEKGEGA